MDKREGMTCSIGLWVVGSATREFFFFGQPQWVSWGYEDAERSHYLIHPAEQNVCSLSRCFSLGYDQLHTDWKWHVLLEQAEVVYWVRGVISSYILVKTTSLFRCQHMLYYSNIALNSIQVNLCPWRYTHSFKWLKPSKSVAVQDIVKGSRTSYVNQLSVGQLCTGNTTSKWRKLKPNWLCKMHSLTHKQRPCGLLPFLINYHNTVDKSAKSYTKGGSLSVSSRGPSIPLSTDGPVTPRWIALS